MVSPNCGAFTILGDGARIQFWMGCTGLFGLSVLDSLEKPPRGRRTEVTGRAMGLLDSGIFLAANLGYGAG